MPNVTGAWSREGMREFLELETIPLRLACRRPGGGLWMLSLWYRYYDGRFEMATSGDADVVGYLESDPGVAFEVSTNEPPYRGVRGTGVAELAEDEDKSLLRALLDRYLGGTDSALARQLLSPERREVRIAIDPETCHTWDFTERMGDVTGGEKDPRGSSS